jgi:HD-like signal output (HDOD) protein/ActR/RegA family two-component response regulator
LKDRVSEALPKQRVLFVDDEPLMLAGLSNLLCRDRTRWDIVFVGGGEEALAELRRNAFDVVVSDMRMPGMDGAALLTAIRDEFPAVVRVMLTGYAEPDALTRAMPAIHQLLNKPCNAKTLRGALERGMNLGLLQGDSELKPIIGRLNRLPSPPDVYHALSAKLTAPKASNLDVYSIIASDPAMCAKVLQLVNNAWFDEARPTCSIEEAIDIVGLEQLGYIAMTASVFGCIEAETSSAAVRELQQAALRCARLVERFIDDERKTDVFVAALLCDIGRLVLTVGVPERYATVMDRAAAGTAVCVAEQEVFGVTHAEVGACLLSIWGLPESIVELVRAHHDPSSAPASLREYAAAVHVADAWIDGRDPDEASLERAGALDRVGGWTRVAGTVQITGRVMRP